MQVCITVDPRQKKRKKERKSVRMAVLNSYQVSAQAHSCINEIVRNGQRSDRFIVILKIHTHMVNLWDGSLFTLTINLLIEPHPAHSYNVAPSALIKL